VLSNVTTDGGIITSGTVSASYLPVATGAAAGIVSTASQTFGGTKYFSGDVLPNSSVGYLGGASYRWNLTAHDISFDGTMTGTLPSHAHAGSDITSGTVALARGGTAADLSATGGATHFLAQDAAHAISARAITASDLSNQIAYLNQSQSWTAQQTFTGSSTLFAGVASTYVSAATYMTSTSGYKVAGNYVIDGSAYLTDYLRASTGHLESLNVNGAVASAEILTAAADTQYLATLYGNCTTADAAAGNTVLYFSYTTTDSRTAYFTAVLNLNVLGEIRSVTPIRVKSGTAVNRYTLINGSAGTSYYDAVWTLTRI
jgi:hypothetical protein